METVVQRKHSTAHQGRKQTILNHKLSKLFYPSPKDHISIAAHLSLMHSRTGRELCCAQLMAQVYFLLPIPASALSIKT